MTLNTLEPDYLLLHPIPYQQKGERERNEAAKEKLIQEKMTEFQNRGYDLTVLAKACSQESTSSLGKYLAKYWNEGKWNYTVFKRLLAVQNSGTIALEYLTYIGERELLPFTTIISDLLSAGSSTEILAKIYRIEAIRTKEVPLVADATETIKKEFWKSYILCNACNEVWVLNESKKYASLDVYLELVYMIHYRKPLSAEQIFECFEGIEKMQYSRDSQMTGYYEEQLLSVLQDEFANDAEKCIRITQLELYFMNLLEWENMKCFQQMIKQVPELFAQLVAGAFKKDHPETGEQSDNQAYVHNMFTIYEKACFCPADRDGMINENLLEQWIIDYRQLLIGNDQESLFTSTLGRLFAYSPIGKDGHEPCEAVRRMIEKYGDERMICSYQTVVYNRRGVFTPTAGKEEIRMAEEFRENAQYLEPHYPITARIFYGLYEIYKRESDRERTDAENGW